MLIVLTIAMLATFMVLVLSERVSALAALVLTPVLFALLAGFGPNLGPMMLKGVQQMAPSGVMLAFAILYFGLMVDAGLFDGLVKLVVRLVHGNPVSIVMGTTLLALTVSIDGNGASTYLICASAMMPLYRRMRLDPRILACVLLLSASITHIVPWAGPTTRVAIALGVSPSSVFLPLVPAMLVGAAAVFGLSYVFGRREQRRLGALSIGDNWPEQLRSDVLELAPADVGESTKRPNLFIVNLFLTITLLACLTVGALPLPVLFMIAATVALCINYPSLESQKLRTAAHAPTIFRVISLTFGSGIFVGVLDGTGMVNATAKFVTELIPAQLGPHLAPIACLLSLPFFFFATNDAYFFGVLTVLSAAAGHYGIAPTEMARAAALGTAVTNLAPGNGTTFLLISLTGIRYGQLQRFALKWAFLLTLILLVAAMLTHSIPM